MKNKVNFTWKGKKQVKGVISKLVLTDAEINQLVKIGKLEEFKVPKKEAKKKTEKAD